MEFSVHRLYLQFSSYLLALKVVISVSIKAKLSEEPSEGVCISVSTNSVLHATSEVFVVDHDTWKLLFAYYGCQHMESVITNSTRPCTHFVDHFRCIVNPFLWWRRNGNRPWSNWRSRTDRPFSIAKKLLFIEQLGRGTRIFCKIRLS